MLNIKKYLKKNNYDINVENDMYVLTKNNVNIKIKKIEFEKLLFLSMIDIIDNLFDEKN